MLYRKIIAFCSQIHTKHINTLCGQNATLSGTYSTHRVVKDCRLENCSKCVVNFCLVLSPTFVSNNYLASYGPDAHAAVDRPDSSRQLLTLSNALQLGSVFRCHQN